MLQAIQEKCDFILSEAIFKFQLKATKIVKSAKYFHWNFKMSYVLKKLKSSVKITLVTLKVFTPGDKEQYI